MTLTESQKSVLIKPRTLHKKEQAMETLSYGSFINERLRVVLFPHGPLSTEASRDACNRLLIFCGADPMRILDQTFAGLDPVDRFMKYIARLDPNELANGIIVLTNTSPVAMRIIGDRIRLRAAFPELDSALWCIFLDPENDPFLWENLKRSGRVIGDPAQAPVFTDHQGMTYLILVSSCTNLETVRANARQMKKINDQQIVDREAPTRRSRSSTHKSK